MRGYKSIIQEAELLAMSPEAVAEFLKKRAKQSMDELDHDPVDEETEVALRGRSSPLIDLALARYARFMETLRPIFQSSEYQQPQQTSSLDYHRRDYQSWHHFL
jgi:hypothetical protein